MKVCKLTSFILEGVKSVSTSIYTKYLYEYLYDKKGNLSSQKFDNILNLYRIKQLMFEFIHALSSIDVDRWQYVLSYNVH